MPILSDKPLEVQINGNVANLANLIQLLNNGNYPESFSLMDRNSLDFIEFFESGPNRYMINSGNNPYGLGIRHAAGDCDREDAGAYIKQFFGVVQIAGGGKAHRRSRTLRRGRRAQRKTRQVHSRV